MSIITLVLLRDRLESFINVLMTYLTCICIHHKDNEVQQDENSLILTTCSGKYAARTFSSIFAATAKASFVEHILLADILDDGA